MNLYTKLIQEVAKCSAQEALRLQDLIDREWLVPDWSESSLSDIRSAVALAQARGGR